MTPQKPPELSAPRRRAALLIVAGLVVLNLAMFTLFFSVAASFSLQQRVITGEGSLLCQQALADELGESAYSGTLIVGVLRYVGPATAEGTIQLYGQDLDDDVELSGRTVRCTFDAPTGRDSLRVVDAEVLP